MGIGRTPSPAEGVTTPSLVSPQDHAGLRLASPHMPGLDPVVESLSLLYTLSRGKRQMRGRTVHREGVREEAYRTCG
jgi:hypothetical protein